MNWVIAKLSSQHDRSSFDCGKPQLNNFIQKLATQYRRRNLGQTYVAVSSANCVIGYYTISTSRVDFANVPDDLRRRFPQIPIPVVLLARLAVDNTYKGHGLGRALLVTALRQAAALSDTIGIAAVEVDAIDDEARSFYRNYGFTSLRDDPRHLYLPIQVIKRSAE